MNRPEALTLCEVEVFGTPVLGKIFCISKLQFWNIYTYPVLKMSKIGNSFRFCPFIKTKVILLSPSNSIVTHGSSIVRIVGFAIFILLIHIYV